MNYEIQVVNLIEIPSITFFNSLFRLFNKKNGYRPLLVINQCNPNYIILTTYHIYSRINIILELYNAMLLNLFLSLLQLVYVLHIENELINFNC